MSYKFKKITVIFILFVDHKKSTIMLDFFKRKCSNSSEVNVGLPTTNVAIPIPKNVDAPILENVHFPIPENVDVSISQTQFQRVDLDSLDYDPGTCNQIWEYHVNQRDFWVFVLVDSLLILYRCVFEIFFFHLSPAPPNLKSWVCPWLGLTLLEQVAWRA